MPFSVSAPHASIFLPLRSPVVTFEFMVGELSNCTTFCGDGIQTRDVECVRLIDDAIQNETVSDSECIMRGMMKPDEVLDCDPGPCPVYVDRGFGDVSWENLGRQ